MLLTLTDSFISVPDSFGKSVIQWTQIRATYIETITISRCHNFPQMNEDDEFSRFGLFPLFLLKTAC